MQHPLVIDAKFRGPPDSGNGGYVSGSIAERFTGDAAIEVTLRAPTPLDQPMDVVMADGAELQVIQGETLIAEARKTELELDVPRPPDFATALSQQPNSPSFIEGINDLVKNGRGFHPICYCCGNDLSPDEGLHVYAASVPGFTGVAAAWRPDSSLADDQGNLSKANIWAALDCPGQFAFYADGILTGLLGRMTGRLLKPVATDQDTVVIGWTIEVERSKHFAGTALFDQSGTLCAYSKQVWIGRRN